MLRLIGVIFLLSTTLWAQRAQVIGEMEFVSTHQERFGLNPYLQQGDYVKKLSALKVAVIDRGFPCLGEKPEAGEVPRYLPSSTQLISGYPQFPEARELDSNDPHGCQVLRTIWAMTGYHKEGPLFYGLNGNDDENVLGAINKAIDLEVNVIAIALVWEVLGSSSREYEIRRALQRAKDQGIIVFVAAGNYGGLVHNAVPYPKDLDGHQYLKFKNLKDVEGGESWYLRFTNSVDENLVTITAVIENIEQREDDLEKALEVKLYGFFPGQENEAPKLIKTESLKNLSEQNKYPAHQIRALLKANRGQLSKSSLDETLRPSRYLIGVEVLSGKFDPHKHRVRVFLKAKKQGPEGTLLGQPLPSVQFQDANGGPETASPANGPTFAVGDFSVNSSKGPTFQGDGKPEFLFHQNRVSFEGEGTYFGTTYATAYMAANATVMLTACPETKPDHFLRFRHHFGDTEWKQDGWETATLSTPLKEFFERSFKPGEYRLKTGNKGFRMVAIPRPVNTPGLFKSLPKEIQEDPSSYQVFVYEHHTPTASTWTQEKTYTTQTWKEPDRWGYRDIWFPRNADGSRDGERVPYRIYGEVKSRQVHTGWKNVEHPQPDVIDVRYWHKKTSETERFPWNELKRSSSEFVEIKTVQLPDAYDTSEPKIFKVPTPDELKKVVYGRTK